MNSSPISVAVYMTDEESPYFEQFLKNTPLPHRLRLIQYRVLPPERARHHCVVYYDEVFPPSPSSPSSSSSFSPFSSSSLSASDLFHTTDQWGKNHTFLRRCENYKERIYPINRLRNLAIQNILTTHFLVLDMDMWPIGAFSLPLLIVESTYQDIITLPPPILRNEHLAIILPAFSLKSSAIEDCSSFQDCVEKAISLLPQTKEQLAACIDREECTTFRPETLTHVFFPCVECSIELHGGWVVQLPAVGAFYVQELLQSRLSGAVSAGEAIVASAAFRRTVYQLWVQQSAVGRAPSVDRWELCCALTRRLSVRSADAVFCCGHSAPCVGIREAMDEALGGEEQSEHHDANGVSEVSDRSSIPHE